MAKPDLASLFGKGGDEPPESDDGDEQYDKGMEDDEELPPDFEAAYQEWKNAEDEHEEMMAFWRAVKSCSDAEGSKKPGLAVMIGLGKGKKS